MKPQNIAQHVIWGNILNDVENPRWSALYQLGEVRNIRGIQNDALIHIY